MVNYIKNHPFGVEAFFERSVVLTFAIPKQDIRSMVPACLDLDTLDDQWAFIAVAMVQTQDLRPKGMPKWMGRDFFLIGYRVFVRYQTSGGKRYRGLYILKSETDSKWMQFAGNIFTHYNYTTTDIKLVTNGDETRYRSMGSDFNVCVRSGQENVNLPKDSPFADWKTARRFAGPLPFTFTVNDEKEEVLIIEGVRQHWQPRPIEVVDYRFSFLKDLQIGSPLLANAFEIRDIPYYWKKGKIDKWN